MVIKILAVIGISIWAQNTPSIQQWVSQFPEDKLDIPRTFAIYTDQKNGRVIQAQSYGFLSPTDHQESNWDLRLNRKVSGLQVIQADVVFHAGKSVLFPRTKKNYPTQIKSQDPRRYLGWDGIIVDIRGDFILAVVLSPLKLGDQAASIADSAEKFVFAPLPTVNGLFTTVSELGFYRVMKLEGSSGVRPTVGSKLLSSLE
jgi:hypothetical protein